MKITAVFMLVFASATVRGAPWDGIPEMPNPTHQCAMWGQCHTVGGFPQACAYSGPALRLMHAGLDQPTRDEVRAILEQRCPHLLYNDDGTRKEDDDVYTCCEVDQFLSMAASMNMADGALGRCPTCLKNFVRQICEMNCSPEQSRFVKVQQDTAPDGSEYVTEIDYYLHEDFFYGAFNSCSDVIVPQTGLPAVNLMCGGAAECNAEAWFGFSGDVENNPFTPTQVNFIPWADREESMSARAPACSETAAGDAPCGCVDCRAACPAGQEPSLPDVCTLLSVHCTGFAVGLTFFVVIVTIFTVLTLLEYKRMRANSHDQQHSTKPNKVNKVIRVNQKVFSNIGAFSAGNPMLIIWLTTCLAFLMYFGLNQLQVSSKPIDIWSAPDSRSRHDFNYFNSRFGPFYRAAQVFLQIEGLESFEKDNVTYGPAFRPEAIRELVNLEDKIINLGREDGGVVLEDVCYAPLRVPGSPPDLDRCVTMSPSTYLGENRNFNVTEFAYLDKIVTCLNNYLGLDCLAPWGGSAEPDIAFGGYEGTNRLKADTLVLNLPISNYLSQNELKPVLEWEQKFLDLLDDYVKNSKPDFIDVSYGTERSIEDEIDRVSRAEVVPIAISYVLMFLYVTLALGKVRSCKAFLTGSKVLLAIGSITVEIVAIYCALSTMGFLGITTTLLSINVIPFFILSVGIDNVFLMVNTLYDIKNNLKEFDDYNDKLSDAKQKIFVFSKMMERIGPSIFGTSAIQITCFALGSMANFPAVQTFAIFATFSLAFLFVFQITTIIALLSLDYDRESKNRLDIFFCIQKKILDDTNPLTSAEPYQSVTQRLMEPYSKSIVNWRVKIIVVIIFVAIVSVSVMLIPQLEIGLDQQLSLPKDSYVYKYLESVNYLFKLGPPVFFVLKSGLNFTNTEHQNAICGGRNCFDDSLITQVFLASLYPDVTHISRGSNSWIDDFFDWSNLPGSCCRYNIEDGSFCQSSNSSELCSYCEIPLDDSGLRPSTEAFQEYIPFFLQDIPDEICNKGGLASYYSYVNYVLDADGRASVDDTAFMAYHIGLGTSKEYITAVKYGYEISENITKAIQKNTGLDVEVFPYSVFYPFYEQYLTIWTDTFSSIAYSLVGVVVITLFTSGFNFLTTFAIILTTIMVVIDMMGMMYIWNIPLNAISCVNLIVSIGIAVEFCNHIVYAYATSDAPSRERVGDALKKVGATIITGITLTNIPIIVLAFSYTEVIEVFFFRMFFGLVVIGFFHGMVFLPVLLSYLHNFFNK
ncbi:unnamed protein product [Plutella xylostella]|uniref:(diamondback moth) hypothetical protein n=1 Tax=Plutella xylostella TaxID=51655 RepID=A0A8S4GAE3_PLUXY|nr:unnamed protein product [Plutella xylostella]